MQYCINFRSAANSATIPTPVLYVAALSTYDGASVLTTVTSQASDFPLCHGIKMSPSGRLPSCLTNPDGSLVAGMLAEPRDCQMMSFRTWCLATLPAAFLHTIAGALKMQEWKNQE